MTRRERHLNILKSFGRQANWHRDAVIARRGYAAFTDEAIEEIRQAMFGLDGYQGTADVSTIKIREILNKIIKLKLIITTTKNMPVSDLKVTLGILKTQRNNFLNLLQVDMFELQN